MTNPFLNSFRPFITAILICCCWWPLALVGQNCNPADIILNSQADVDNFQATYGPCTTVTGNLTIAGPTNLDGLTGLTSVSGNLSFEIGGILTNIDGLVNLTSVGGDLNINNTVLTNIDGLANLTSVGGRLLIILNGFLTNIDGLANLTSIGGDLNMGTNGLTNIDGLANLTNVGGNLSIENHPNLSICCGLFPLLNGAGVTGNVTISGSNGGGNCSNDGTNITAICMNRPPRTPFSTNVTGIQQTPFCFTLAHFPFIDVNQGATISQVDITTLPSVGTLFLDVNNNGSNDGGAEILGAGADITITDINAGRLKYIQSGTASASFTFGVSDGTVFSAAPAGTVMIMLNPQPPIPTMTEWGMLIFALLMLNLGVFYVRKQNAYTAI